MHIHVLICLMMDKVKKNQTLINDTCTVKHARHFFSVMTVEIITIIKKKIEKLYILNVQCVYQLSKMVRYA